MATRRVAAYADVRAQRPSVSVVPATVDPRLEIEDCDARIAGNVCLSARASSLAPVARQNENRVFHRASEVGDNGRPRGLLYALKIERFCFAVSRGRGLLPPTAPMATITSTVLAIRVLRAPGTILTSGPPIDGEEILPLD